MVKIGQIIEFQQDKKIKIQGGGTLLVKKGDRAQVLRKVDEGTGEILYITGAAKGKSQVIAIDVDETIDSDGIAKKIMDMIR